RVVETLQDFVDKVIVVTGKYHEDTVAALAAYPKVMFVRNPLYAMGMFSSVQCGVQAAQGDLLIMPGDVPLVKKTTIQALLAAAGDVRVPVFRHRKGHPIFIAKRLRFDLLGEEDEQGLKAFRDRHDPTWVETDDEGILIDVDSMKDYEHLSKHQEGVAKHAD
ncbi:MAG: NTP transferase domain-containing protein, partial [bacterium]